MDHFATLRDALKQANPTISISVRRCKMTEKLLGDCLRMDGYFRVRINADRPEQVQLDTLVHEFAHAIAYLEWENTGEHGPQWAQAHLDCYRIYEKTVTG
ncbi:MAG: hypothetical protein RLZZ396_2095 [Planctomycetota bacterium]|jgi:hypothetical protein